MVAKSKKKESKARYRDYKVLLGPVMTEKASYGDGSGGTVLVLRVDPNAKKPEIREAVERVFSVKVASVNTVNSLGKPKRVGQSIGRRAAGKKAYITLQAGEKIDLFEGL